MPRTIWGERRFFVPGVVMLAVLAVALALSGSFNKFEKSDTEIGIAAIAAIAAGGLAGYPLGIILYAPFALLFRLMGSYNHYVDYYQLCDELIRICQAGGVRFESLRARSREALGDPNAERTLLGYLYERLAPNAVRWPAEGRWETYHTIGGMIVAIVLGFIISIPVVLVVPHGDPWWDQRNVLLSVSLITTVVLAALLLHTIVIAREAAAMQRQWFRLLFDLLQRKPELADVVALSERFDASNLVGGSGLTPSF